MHGSAETVVDVDDGYSGRAGVEHGQQSREPAEGCAVSHRGRHRHQGHARESADHAGQRTLHAGHHHQRIRLIEVFADGQQSVQPGHAHIADRVDLGAEHPSGRGGFRGDGQIRGTSADDQDLSDSFWKRTEHSGTADGIEADLRKAVLQCAGGAVVHPGGQHSTVGVRLLQRRHYVDGLVGRLALREHDLGVTGALRAVGVDARETEVDERILHVRDDTSSCGPVERRDAKAPRAGTSQRNRLVDVTPIGYLGPEGTFSQAALLLLLAAEEPQPPTQAFGSVTSALEAVRQGEAAAALVPIENSVEGSVPATLDELASGDPLMIAAEISLPVQFNLWVRPGTQLADIKRVTTHPHAQAQCRAWLHDALPDAEVVPAMSTASAAAAVAGEQIFDAAIAAPWAGEPLGLHAAAQDIADNPDATTRFVLVRPHGQPPAPTGADKTTLVLFMREDHPGALLQILTEFSVRGVNLTLIQSRPTRKAMGDYFFTIDCEGHVDDARVGEALAGLHRLCAEVRFLGSYARHDGKTPSIRPGTTNTDFADSTEWLRGIRAR